MNNLGCSCVDNATCCVLKSSVQWFWRRGFFKVVTIYGHGGHYWLCDPTHLYKFSFPFSLELSYELWFQIAQLFFEKNKF